MNASDTPPAAAINAVVAINYPADSVIVCDNQERVLLTNTLSPLHESTGTERTNQRRVIHSAPNEVESIVESINSEGVILPALDNASPFEKYYEDQTVTLPKQKIPLILMYSMTGIVDGFSLSSLHETPYKEQNIHTIKPKKSWIKEEIKRLDPSAARLSAATLGELLEMLATTHADHFTVGCRQFINKKHGEIFDLFNKSLQEKNDNETRTASRITDCDRLRFVEAMISDEVRDVYRLSQESLTRSELDSRNSTERDPTFTEKISEKFNDDSWKPFTTAYPSLHSDFVSPILCECIEFVMTPEKVIFVQC